MSLIDIHSLTKKELIYHFVLEHRNSGMVLSPNDLEVVESWLKEINNDCDSLLLILSDILPKYYSGKTKKVPLSKIKVSVSKKIKDHLLTHSQIDSLDLF